MVEDYSGGGAVGSSGINALVIGYSINSFSSVLGSTTMILLRGISTATAGIFLSTPEISPFFSYSTLEIS